MKFELVHALWGLESATPQFFKIEALAAIEDLTAKEIAARVLSSTGGPKAVALLKEILRLV